MRRKTFHRWLPAAILLLLTWLTHGGCGRDAFVVVHVDGASDQRIQMLVLTATVSGLSRTWQATEAYSGHPAEVSFYLPDGTLGGALSVEVAAWDATYTVARGTSSGTVENRPRLDLSVQLQPVGS